MPRTAFPWFRRAASGRAPFPGTGDSRYDLPAETRSSPFRYSLHGFVIVFAMAFAGFVVGYLLGALHGPDYSAWEDLAKTLGILGVPSFVRVAYIHNASYLGGLIGLIAAIIYVRRRRNAVQARAANGNMPARSEADQSPSAPDPLKPH